MMNVLKKLLCLALCFVSLTAAAQEWDFTLVAGREHEGNLLRPNWQTVKVQAPAPEAPSVQPFFVVGETWLTEKDVANTRVDFDVIAKEMLIMLTFTPEGKRKLAELTTRNITQKMVLTDGQEQHLFSSLLIDSEVENGELRLATGNIFEMKETFEHFERHGLRVYLTHPEHGRKLMLQKVPVQPVLDWDIDSQYRFTADDFEKIQILEEPSNWDYPVYSIVAIPTAAAKKRLRKPPKRPYTWLLLNGGQPPVLLHTAWWPQNDIMRSDGKVLLQEFRSETEAFKALVKLRRTPPDDKTPPKQ